MQVSDVISESLVNGMVLGVKIALFYVAVVWVALAFWTYRDIRRRTNDATVMTLSVLLVLAFFVPGYWLYLILRPRLTLAEQEEERLRRRLLMDYSSACPACGDMVREDFVVCPSCRCSLRTSCGDCSHALQANWHACPYCGKAIATDPVAGRPGVAIPENRPVGTPRSLHA